MVLCKHSTAYAGGGGGGGGGGMVSIFGSCFGLAAN